MPDAPSHLSDDLRILLTELCFMKTEKLESVDLIFVCGNPSFQELAEHISNLLHNKVSHKVMLTGGVTSHESMLKKPKSEARLIYEALLKIGMPENVDFFLEEDSLNTLENVLNALTILNFKNYNRLCFVFPAHGAKRAYLTLRKFLPDTKIFSAAYHDTYPNEGEPIKAESWHNSTFAIKRVWGEYLRIKEYGSRGDIAYDEVKDLVLQIEKVIELS